MKEIIRFLSYGIGTMVVILILVQYSSGEGGTGGSLVALAILLVVVLPVVLGIALVNRAKRKEAEGKQ